MDPNQVLKSDLDDLIFEGRNKDYGAYELRKHYKRRMAIALSATGVVLAMSIMGNLIAQEKQHGVYIVPNDVIVRTQVIADEPAPPPPPPPPPAPPAPPAAPRTIIFNAPVIVDRPDVPDMPTIDETRQAQIGDQNIDGPDGDGPQMPKVPGVPGGVPGVVAPPPPDPNAIVYDISIQASTDLKNWIRHLQRTLEYPAMEAAEKGLASGNYTVQVKFVVEKDGSVSQVSALNDPGYGLADAAVKAVSKGPRWSPGEQNGIKVRSWHTQPITFSVTSE